MYDLALNGWFRKDAIPKSISLRTEKVNLKILFCCDSLNQGGAEKQMTLLATMLSEAGHEIAVWSLHNGAFAGNLRAVNISVIVRERPMSMKEARSSVSETLNSFEPDVIHIWGTAILLICYWIFSRSSIPLVNGFIRFGVLSGSTLNKIRNLICARIGDIVVANSQAGLNACHVSAKKGRVLPNGFDWSKVNVESSITRDDDYCYVVMCANITKFKDYLLLIDTAQLATSKYNGNRYRFLIIGRPIPSYEIEPIKLRAADLIEKGIVQLVGGVDNPFPYLHTSDIGILLSTRGEGISNSIMEYMVARLPVICTNAGGNPDLVDEKSGILIEKNVPECILDQLDYLVNNPIIRKQMGESGFSKIKNNFSIEIMLETAIQIYREVATE